MPVLALLLAATLLTAADMPSFADLDRNARTGKPLTVVFFGGSLTWGANASDPQRSSYRARIEAWLRSRYPLSPIVCVDAAIGGVGSNLGMFRVDRDVLTHRPDLVFLDFTANDDHYATDAVTLACYERVVRHLLTAGVPVVQVLLPFRYTYQQKVADAWKGMPRYQAHLALGHAYGLAQGDAIAHVGACLDAGTATIAELWPFDGAHPDDAGYARFAEAVIAGFTTAVEDGRRCQITEEPLHRPAFTEIRRRDLPGGLDLPAGWEAVPTWRTALWFDGQGSRWMDGVVRCAIDPAQEQPAPLDLIFHGRYVGLFGECDGNSPDLAITIDGRPIPDRQRKDAPLWTVNTARFGGGRLYFWRVLADDLSDGEHRLSIQVVARDGIPKGEIRLGALCTAR